MQTPRFKKPNKKKYIYKKCSKTYFSVCKCSFLVNKLLVSWKLDIFHSEGTKYRLFIIYRTCYFVVILSMSYLSFNKLNKHINYSVQFAFTNWPNVHWRDRGQIFEGFSQTVIDSQIVMWQYIKWKCDRPVVMSQIEFGCLPGET